MIIISILKINDVVECIDKAIELITNLANIKILDDMIIRSKSYISKFTWKNIAKSFVQIEKSLIG